MGQDIALSVRGPHQAEMTTAGAATATLLTAAANLSPEMEVRDHTATSSSKICHYRGLIDRRRIKDTADPTQHLCQTCVGFVSEYHLCWLRPQMNVFAEMIGIDLSVIVDEDASNTR